MKNDVQLPPDLPRFEGGRSLMIGSAIAGAAGLFLTLIGVLTNPRDALLAYLVAFAYWIFMVLGALALVMANHTAGARWNVVVRRISESIAAPIPIFLVLFLPLLLGARHVWSWVAPEAVGKEFAEEIHHKAAWLNLPFFAVRLLLYFGVWTLLAWLLRSWSLAQDDDGAVTWTQKMRKLSPGGLIALALTLTFASFDWIMSLSPLWYSTIFGLYVFAGGFVGSLALTCIVVTGIRSGTEPLARLITVEHQHNLAKLLLAFVAFWAYMGFSQYMLIWAGNLPEEIPFITIRSHGPWRALGILLILGHFALPFLLLLSRDLKRRTGPLAAVSAWLLVVHYLDVYWLVMPTWHVNDLGFHWTHLTSLIGIGGLTVAAALFLLRGRYALPVKDPYLEDSLRYAQP